MNGTCPNCGAPLIGDGYRDVLRCENADPESYAYHEPEADPIFCSDVQLEGPGPVLRDPVPAQPGRAKLTPEAE